jgi:hypothetical protein
VQGTGLGGLSSRHGCLIQRETTGTAASTDAFLTQQYVTGNHGWRAGRPEEGHPSKANSPIQVFLVCKTLSSTPFAASAMMDGPPQLPPLAIPPSSPLASSVTFDPASISNLRKSLSVDSFVKNRQTAGPSGLASHANPGPDRTTFRSGVQTAFVGGWHDRDRAFETDLGSGGGPSCYPISSTDDDLDHVRPLRTPRSAQEIPSDGPPTGAPAGQQLWLPTRLKTLRKPSSNVSLTSSHEQSRPPALLSHSVSGNLSAANLASSHTGRIRSGSLDQAAGKTASKRYDAQPEARGSVSASVVYL